LERHRLRLVAVLVPEARVQAVRVQAVQPQPQPQLAAQRPPAR